MVVALIAALLLCAAVALDRSRPIWFGPPLHIYTPLAYALLPLIWLPVLILGAVLGIVRSWKLVLLLFILGALFTCAWWALTGPRTGPEVPYLGANGDLTCQYEPSAQSQRRFICEHHISSSDVSTVRYVFVVPGRLPFLILAERETLSR
jgi:hypothetical protein